MIKIFIDFDGTITRKDVGDAMFEKFGGGQCVELVGQYEREKISAVECFCRECDACGTVDKIALDGYLDSQEIDSTFKQFADLCEDQGFEYWILSDGMDYYIRKILNRHGLSHIPFFANTLELVPSGTSDVRLKPVFPYTDEVCDRCASCKRNHIVSLSGDDDIIVYIGEGYSDRCPARYADIVFAKDELLTYCRQQNISYFEYQTFNDIRRRFESLIAGSGTHANRLGLARRRQAALARRDLFLCG